MEPGFIYWFLGGAMFGQVILKIRDFMSVPRDNPELLKAQYRAFSRQLPLMYFILLTNTWALAVSHYADAPVWLTVSTPALFTVLCGIRVAGWWRSRYVVPTAEIAFRALTLTNRLTGILTITFSAWALALCPYGDQLARAHVAFYMAITVIACIFSLMHLRPAAFTVAISANIVFIAFFGSSGHLTFMAMAANALLVTGAMMFILQANYRDFAQMVDGRTSLKALSNENFRLANLDSLTGLPNRRQFFARLDEEFLAAQTQGYRLAVGVVDLDGFKPVNDIYGHAVGDKLLIAVGERLRAACGEAHVARLGGDEFALIIRDVSDAELLKRGEKICTALRKTFDLTEASVQISGSVGFTVFPELASTATDLYEQADYAPTTASGPVAAMPCCSRLNMRPKSIATARSNGRCARPISTRSFRSCFSRSSMPGPKGPWALRPLRAGTAQRLAVCPLTSSFRWRKEPASSAA